MDSGAEGHSSESGQPNEDSLAEHKRVLGDSADTHSNSVSVITAEDGTSVAEGLEKISESKRRLLTLENRLVRLDRMLLSDGLRLLIILPVVSTILLFTSWFARNSSPTFWATSVEPAMGLGFSAGMALLAVVVLVGDTATLTMVRSRYKTTHRVFRLESKKHRLLGHPLDSMHGTSALLSHTQGVIRHRTLAILLVISVIGLSLMATWSGLSGEDGGTLILLATCLGLTSLGHHLLNSRRPYNASERWGLLDAYEPPIHPATLDHVFSDLLITHMDPLLAAQFEKFLAEFEQALRPDIDPVMGKERFLTIHHLHREGLIDTMQRRSEVLELVREDALESIVNHQWFDDELWAHLLRRVNERTPAFFRLVERLRHNLERRSSSLANEELIFDVDMENVVFEAANLFCIMFNNTDEPRRVVLRLQSPDFRPGDFSYTCKLGPGKGVVTASPDIVQLSARGDDDVLATMSKLLDESTMVWQTLLPVRLGEATVTVRLEEPDGDLIIGRQINVRVRSEYNRRLSSGTGILALSGGIVGVIATLLSYWGILF